MTNSEPKPDDRSDPEKVREKWNDTFHARVNAPVRKFSWHSTTVTKFMQETYFEGRSINQYLKHYLGDRPVRHGLDVGGGLGNAARGFYQLLSAQRFDVMDISTYAVEQGNARAKEDGLNMVYSVADLNKDTLPNQTYDLITASGALHHIANLEHLFEQIANALTPDGIFFANDYFGPNYMQWTETQLNTINAIIACLPDEMNVVSHKQDRVMKEVTRIPLEIFERVDPSEGVRASDILDVMKNHLEIVRIVPFGQTIVYELLRGRVQNFNDDDPKDSTILKLICLIEKLMMDSGVIGSDFNLVIAKRKDGQT